MKESVGGCGKADQFGDVCGSSNYRSGELAINLCDECIIANLRSCLAVEREEVKRLTTSLCANYREALKATVQRREKLAAHELADKPTLVCAKAALQKEGK